MHKTLIAFAVFAMLPMTAPAAEICESVNDAANAWNAMGNLVHETQGEGFTDEEVAELEGAVAHLTEATAVLAGALQTGNEHQVDLGEHLEAVLTVLADGDDEADADYITSVLDEVTATMDAVTDDCDAAHAE